MKNGTRKQSLAHRVSYELFVAEIAEGLQLDHLCRTRCCVNPYHLEAVTAYVNQMRGETIAAINAAKTHCPIGHDLANARREKNKAGLFFRRCRQCRNASERRRYAKTMGACK